MPYGLETPALQGLCLGPCLQVKQHFQNRSLRTTFFEFEPCSDSAIALSRTYFDTHMQFCYNLQWQQLTSRKLEGSHSSAISPGARLNSFLSVTAEFLRYRQGTPTKRTRWSLAFPSHTPAQPYVYCSCLHTTREASASVNVVACDHSAILDVCATHTFRRRDGIWSSMQDWV